ncbi:larval serum protein 1 beta chain-like [Anastrepha obliqua]|uniref:larval serum protein 1 beta chain-like n=1 Tax=Anastrepha obliqua TaxID=95512 RepID=UPI0024093154|nr:larval serum protein 1 beta chain-like [Anastrepha obliqua]
MKLTILLLCSCVAALSASNAEPPSSKDNSRKLLMQQKFLLEVLWQVQEPLGPDYCQGIEYVADEALYEKYDSDMQRFVKAVRHQRLLPRSDFFSALVRTHHAQALGLFKLFYYAKDWQTFEQNVCWARANINAGMFVYALNLAVTQRVDCVQFSLPQIYEILPQHFFNSQLVNKGMRFSERQWEREQAVTNESANVLQDWLPWQWWKFMGLSDERWYKDEQNSHAEKATEFNEVISGITKYWTPVDYTRDISMLNPESQLSYFFEDVDFNRAWYDFHLEYAPFLDEREFPLYDNRAGELWIYYTRLIMAHYNMERLSHGMAPWEDMLLSLSLATGYNPQLVSWNGLTFWQRYNNWEFEDYGFPETIDLVLQLTDEIYKLGDTGAYWHTNGTLLNFHQPEMQQHFYNIIHGNVNGFQPKVHQTYWYYSFMFLAQVDYDQFSKVGPHVLLNHETALRDPLFYTVMNYKVLDMWRRYIVHLPAYTATDLGADGIELVSVQMDPLVTYFEYADFDVSNLWSAKVNLTDSHAAIYARQQRLTHKPFRYTLHIQSKTASKVMVQSFLAPKYNERDELISLEKNRANFQNLDNFVVDLQVGDNAVMRPEKYALPASKRWSFSEMFFIIEHCLQNGLEYPTHLKQPQSSYFRRLDVPKGRPEGFPVVLFFLVSPYSDESPRVSYSYPFDRMIESESAFQVPNAHFKDAMIYHVDHKKNVEEYVVLYENFGKFDENYWKLD